MKRLNILAVLFTLLLSSIAFIFPAISAQETIVATEKIGEAFGKPVLGEEFYYYYKTALMLTRTGKEARSEEAIRQEAWENLVFRQEAKNVGITLEPKELRTEMDRLLKEKGVAYGTPEYKAWAKKEFDDEPGVLERRIGDLLVINKFLKIKTSPEVTVTEEEMKQKFMNQYSSFESEYIMFADEKDVKDFAVRVKKDPKLWAETYNKKKPEGQKGASWINIMSLEALIDLWQIPKEDAYNILSHKEGDFIVAKFYYGTAVFRLLQKKEADLKTYDEKRQEYYRNSITDGKKRKIIKAYFDDLIKRAGIRDYVLERRQAAKIEELKNKTAAVIETTSGKITLRLYPEAAPMACENFVALIEKGYYDGTIFHRVIKDFMIQGGDPKGTGEGGDSIWNAPFEDEVSDSHLFDKPGILAMANSGANTNKSQFFITTKATPWLNKKHTIFGEVVSGYDIVEKISNMPVDASSKPKAEQKITKAYIEGFKTNIEQLVKGKGDKNK
jgi:Peptidyl-prolyl cis-trans isomerase (rotamase) - cyclophilin family